MCNKYASFVPYAVIGALLTLFSPALSHADDSDDFDPPEQTIGERLFLETRFAQFFATNSPASVNAPLVNGDPVMDITEAFPTNFPRPFVGQSMNCRACHLVDEQGATPGGGNRTYCDFTRRSPIPDRGDGLTRTPRNSPPL